MSCPETPEERWALGARRPTGKGGAGPPGPLPRELGGLSRALSGRVSSGAGVSEGLGETSLGKPPLRRDHLVCPGEGPGVRMQGGLGKPRPVPSAATRRSSWSRTWSAGHSLSGVAEMSDCPAPASGGLAADRSWVPGPRAGRRAPRETGRQQGALRPR